MRSSIGVPATRRSTSYPPAPVFGITIGVGVVLVLCDDPPEPDELADDVFPPMIGPSADDLPAAPEPDVWVPRAGWLPSGIRMGVGLSPPPPPPLPPDPALSSESCEGGQSTDFGGQASPPPPPPEESPGGEHPAPAPKSPAVVQSAPARPAVGTMPSAAVTAQTATAPAIRRRHVADCLRLISKGCRRRRSRCRRTCRCRSSPRRRIAPRPVRRRRPP
jgi:hypothetical protein